MGGKEVRKMSCGAQPEQNSLPETPSGIPPTADFFQKQVGVFVSSQLVQHSEITQ